MKLVNLRTKFFEICPLWIISIEKQLQETYKCIYHENIDTIFKALLNKDRF